MAFHMHVVGYRATSVTRWKQLGQIYDSTGKVGEERKVCLTTLSQIFGILALFWNR